MPQRFVWEWFKKLGRQIRFKLIMTKMRFRRYYDRKKSLRQLKREEYHLKELKVKDPADPRVLLSQRHILGPHPMSLSKVMGQQVLDQCRRAEAEAEDMAAQIEAGTKVDLDNPQPRPEEVERILREMSASDKQ